MKIIVVTHPNTQRCYHLIADSSVLANNKPFFIPDFAPAFVLHPAIAVRINRLGKTIAPRFASRYYQAVAACAIVEAAGMEGNPFDARHTAFDGAFFQGEFMPVESIQPRQGLKVELFSNDRPADATAIDLPLVDEVIAEVSQYFTLKMGDIIVLGSHTPGFPLAIGQHISATINDAPSLKMRIK